MDLRRVGEIVHTRARSATGRSARERARHGCSAFAAVALFAVISCVACSEQQHTVGIYDLNAEGGTGGRAHLNAGTGGDGDGAPSTGDGSTSFVDAAIPIPDAAPQCAQSVAPTVRKRLDLYFLIDTNFFASASENWQKVVQGIRGYSQRDESAGTGLGLRVIDPPPPQLLPLGQDPTCDPNTYSRVSAVIGPDPLPANVQEIADALSNVTASVTTPLDPALAGGIRLAASRKAAYPDREQAVVMISDAFFDFSCGSSVTDLVQTAEQGLSRNRIRSYMVELVVEPLGPFMPILDGLPVPTKIAFDPIAAAGGTQHARTLHMQDDSASDLADTLLEIQRDAEPCDYLLPDDMDWDDTLLAVDTGAGPGPVPRLSSEAECGPIGGAYLDSSTGTSWARACPASCAAIKATARPPVWIVGCDPSDP